MVSRRCQGIKCHGSPPFKSRWEAKGEILGGLSGNRKLARNGVVGNLSGAAFHLDDQRGHRTSEIRPARRLSRNIGQPDCAVSTARTIIMTIVTTSKITCSVFGRRPLRSGKKACVVAYIT